MKVLLYVYLYLMYAISLPVLVLFTIAMIIIHSIKCIREKWGIEDWIDGIKALFAGYAEGHNINIHNINSISE